MDSKILCIINNKGGVGKTTTASAIAETLASIGKKILVVDMDPQANLTRLMTNTSKVGDKTIVRLFECRSSELTTQYVQDTIKETEYEDIDILAGDEDFSFTADKITYDTSRVQQKVLDTILSRIKEYYDYILIDCAPYFNILTTNALYTSDYVLTPVEYDGFSYEGLTKLLEKIYDAKNEFNPKLNFLGAFFTKVNSQTQLFKGLYESYKEELADNFIQQYIRQDIKAKESVTVFKPLLHYEPSCNAAQDYRKLCIALNILDEKSQQKLTDTWTCIEKVIQKSK